MFVFLATILILSGLSGPVYYAEVNPNPVTSIDTIAFEEVVGLDVQTQGVWLGIWASWLQAQTPNKRAQLEVWVNGNTPYFRYGRSNVARLSGEFVPTQGAFLVQANGTFHAQLRVREYNSGAIATAKDSSMSMLRMDFGPQANYAYSGFDSKDDTGQVVAYLDWTTIQELQMSNMNPWSGYRQVCIVVTAEYMAAVVNNTLSWRLMGDDEELACRSLTVLFHEDRMSRESQAVIKLKSIQYSDIQSLKIQVRSTLGTGNVRRSGIMVFDYDAWVTNFG